MVSNGDMNKLAELARRPAVQLEWRTFAEFAELRGRGARSEALKKLGQFLGEASGWSFTDRFTFTKWALEESRQFEDRNFFLPQPIHTRLIVPTVREWADRSSTSAEPRLWLGLLGCDNPSLHLEIALELDPSCESARQTLTQWILADVEYNQHHLPALYIHDPKDDLKALNQAEILAGVSSSKPWAFEIQLEIDTLRALTEGWLALHPRPGDFAIH